MIAPIMFIGSLYCSFSMWPIFNFLSCNYFVLVTSTMSYNLLKSSVLAKYSDLMSNRSILPMILHMSVCVCFFVGIMCVFVCVFCVPVHFVWSVFMRDKCVCIFTPLGRAPKTYALKNEI